MLKRFQRPQRSYSVRIEPFDVTVEVGRDETLLDAALRAGVPFPHDCKVGSCTTCKCRLVAGKTRALQDPAYVLGMDEIESGYILACQTAVKSDLTVRLEGVTANGGSPESSVPSNS